MNITNLMLKAGLNHRTGRRDVVRGIAIHVTEGTAESVISWFRNDASDVSAHYMVKKDGGIVQFVSEADEAYAQGRVDRPTAQIVLDRPNINPNAYLISIEHEGDGQHELTDAQRVSSIELIRDICARYDLQIDRYHIVGHHEIYFPKPCPGKIDVDRLVRESWLPPGAPDLPDPPMVWSGFLNDWLIVVRATSDRDWFFVPLRQVQTTASLHSKAQTALSAMPKERPS